MTPLDQIFNAFFAVVPYGFFVGCMGFIVIFEFCFTFFENWDML